MIIGLYDYFVIVIALNDVVKHQEIRVQPYHPDKAGGRGAVGRFVANIGYIVASIAVFAVLIWLQDPDIYPSLYQIVLELIPVLYLIIAPTSFFLPLWS